MEKSVKKEPDGKNAARDFIVNLRRAWNESCLSAGIPSISDDSAATILATVYLYGNNEAMVINPMLVEDLRYIQKRHRIEGGEIPDPDFSMLVKERIGELEEYDATHAGEPAESGMFRRNIPSYVRELFMSRYGIKLIN